MVSVPSVSPQMNTGQPQLDSHLNILTGQAITPALQAIQELQSLVTTLQAQVKTLQK
jgi:hypothetical protein